MDNDQINDAPSRPRLFVAFEGGGAKGVVHVGALKAIETYQPVYLGFAGTSAGAIVAALAAVGYTADDLVNPVARTTFLDQLIRDDGSKYGSAAELFGSKGWAAMQRLAKLIGRGFLLRLLSIVGIAVLSVCVGAAFFGWATGFVLALGWLAWALVRVVNLYLGATRLDEFRKAMNKALAVKLGRNGDESVTFGDLKQAGCPLLKIVATDIERRQMSVFGADTEEGASVAVADAVAASVCIPLVFKPRTFGGGTYLDGGLVSNLPAWVFDEERALDPLAITVAAEIRDSLERPCICPSLNWLEPALRTSIFGRSGLNKRVSGQLITIPLPSNLGLLQFDADLGKATALPADPEPRRREIGKLAIAEKRHPTIIGQVVLAQFVSEVRLRRDLATLRGLLKDGVNLLVEQDGVFDCLDRAGGPIDLGPRLGSDGQPGEEGRIRVALAIVPLGNVKSLRLVAHVGYDGEADEGMLLPIDGSFVGKAYRTGDAQLADRVELSRLREKLADTPESVAPEMGRVIDRTWPAMQWSLCIPVPAKGAATRSRSQLVVAIDSDRPICGGKEEAFRQFQDLIARRCESIFPTLVELLEERNRPADPE